MLKIMYQFLRRLHRLMKNIGEDQGIFLAFWEVYFLEKKASQTQYIDSFVGGCVPKNFSDIKRKCVCLLIFISFFEIEMLRHDPASSVSPINGQISKVQSGTELYSVQNCTELYSVVQSCTFVQSCTELYRIVQSCTELYNRVVQSCT